MALMHTQTCTVLTKKISARKTWLISRQCTAVCTFTQCSTPKKRTRATIASSGRSRLVSRCSPLQTWYFQFFQIFLFKSEKSND